MTKRRQAPPWRAALLRYEDGVHELGEPAAEEAIGATERRLGLALPPSLRAFLRTHDGATLFHEAYRILGCADMGGDLIGWEGDAKLFFDPGRARSDGEMPVMRAEPGSEQALTVGSRFDRWLHAVLVREELVYEPDGEFRDVFDAATAELRLDTLRRREERALRVDPEAPATHYELGRLYVHEGRADRAVACFRRALDLEPDFAWAHFELGRQLRRSEPAQAAAAFMRAADLDDEQPAVFRAWAARALLESGDARKGAEARARIRLTDPDFARRYKELGQQLLANADPNAADMLGLAWAVDPDDAELSDLLARAERAAPRKGRPRRRGS